MSEKKRKYNHTYISYDQWQEERCDGCGHRAHEPGCGELEDGNPNGAFAEMWPCGCKVNSKEPYKAPPPPPKPKPPSGKICGMPLRLDLGDMMKWFDAVPMTSVVNRIWVGGYVQAARLVEDNTEKITAVLNVSTEPPYQKNPDIVYMHIPFHDGHKIPSRQFAECLSWLKFMYEHGHNILIHCAAGISRSVTITAAFMHYLDITDFDTAMDRIRLARPIASPASAVLVSA